MIAKMISLIVCLSLLGNCSDSNDGQTRSDPELGTETGSGGGSSEGESGNDSGSESETESETEKISLTTYESEVFDLINKHRTDNGLEALVYSSVIQKECEDHTLSMAERTTEFGHDGFDTRSDNIRSKLSGIRSVAENVAYGSYPAEEVVEGWLNSSGHRKNIEGNYTIACLSAKQDVNDRWYYTQMFARK